MSDTKLNSDEAKLMDEITQDNKLMRRKLEGNQSRRKSTRRVPVRVYKPDENGAATGATDAPDDMLKKLQELEKMQVMYKQRIDELENQVIDFNFTRPAAQTIRSPNRKKKYSNDYQYINPSPTISSTSPKITHASPPIARSPQIGTASPKILHSSPKINHSSPRSLRSPKSAQYNTSPRTNSSPRRRKNGDSRENYSDSRGNYGSDSKVSTSPSQRNKQNANRPRVLALYDYIPGPDVSGRLEFKEGDVLWLVNSKSRSGWWVAESLDGRSGKIPSNYVEQLDLSKSYKARVIQSFEAQQNGDLGIQRGSIITILKKQENGWFLGERGFKTGFFPASNVEKVDMISPSS